MSNVSRRLRFIALTFALALSFGTAALAQDTGGGANTRTVASGQKMKIKGVVTRRDPDSFVVQDANGVSTTVVLNNSTSIKTTGGFLRGIFRCRRRVRTGRRITGGWRVQGIDGCSVARRSSRRRSRLLRKHGRRCDQRKRQTSRTCTKHPQSPLAANK